MNGILKKNFEKSYKTQKDTEIGFPSFWFNVFISFIFLFDIAYIIKAALVGTTIYGFIIDIIAIICEIAFVIVLNPKKQYNMANRVGLIPLLVLLALPIIIIGIDAGLFKNRLDIFLLVMRIAMLIILAILFCIAKSVKSMQAISSFILFFILCCISLSSIIVNFANEQDFSGAESYDVRYIYKEVDDGIEIEGYCSFCLGSNKYQIPTTVNGENVVSLGSHFADNIKNEETLVIPKNIKRIDSSAFASSNISSLIIETNSISNFEFVAQSKSINKVKIEADISDFSEILKNTETDVNFDILVSEETLENYRKNLFDNNLDYSHLIPMTENVYYINPISNCNTYIPSIVASSAEDVQNAIDNVINSEISYTYRNGMMIIVSNEIINAGWYTTSDFTPESKINVGDKVDLTDTCLNLYLRWVPEYNIEFVKDGWTFTNAQYNTYKYSCLDEDIVLPEAQKEGYTFKGWYLDKTYKDKIEIIDTDSSENYKLYPRFLKHYNLEFNCNGGTTEETMPTYYHNEMSFDLPTLRKDGYIFEGWCENSDLSDTPVTAINLGQTGDKQYYAKFTAIPYTITFDSDKGMAIESKIYTIEDSNIDLSNSAFIPTRKGFNFAGWVDENNNIVSEWDTSSLVNTTLKATWTLANFKAKLSTNSILEVYGDNVEIFVDLDGDWYINDNEVSYTYEWYKKVGEEYEKTNLTADRIVLRNVNESGQYKVVVNGKYKDQIITGDEDVAVNGVTVTISPRPIRVVWQAPSNLVYNKTEKRPSATIDNLINNDECEFNIQITGSQNNINAGSVFTFNVTQVDNENYTIVNGENITSTQYTILPKQAVLSWTAPSNLIYDGTPKQASAQVTNLEEGDDCEVTVQLSNDNDNVNVGSFKYTAISLSNSNYTLQGVNAESESYVITPKSVTAVWTAPSNLEYDGNAKVPTLTIDGVAGGDSYTAVINTGDNVNVTSAGFTYKVSGLGNNYSVANAVSSTYKLTQKVLTLTWNNPDSLVYNKQAKKATANLSGVVEGDDCSVSCSYGNNINAGEATAKATLTGAKCNNYKLPSNSVYKYTITPLPVSISWTAPENLTYNKNAKTPTASVANLISGDNCTVTADVTSECDNVNVGNFTFTVIGLSNNNYTLQDATSVTSATYTIAPKAVTLSWTAPSNLIYDGTPKQASAQVTNLEEGDDCEVTVQLNSDNDNVNVGSFKYTAISLSNSNYTLQGVNAESESYTITPKEVELEWTAPSNLVYDGNLKNASVELIGVIEGDDCSASISYNDNINAGDVTAEVELVGTKCNNYSLPSNSEYTFTIVKADRTEIQVAIDDWVVDETESTPSIVDAKNQETADVTIVYMYSDSETGEYSETKPNTVGTYYIKAIISASENYNEFTTEPVAFSITEGAGE